MAHLWLPLEWRLSDALLLKAWPRWAAWSSGSSLEMQSPGLCSDSLYQNQGLHFNSPTPPRDSHEYDILEALHPSLCPSQTTWQHLEEFRVSQAGYDCSQRESSALSGCHRWLMGPRSSHPGHNPAGPHPSPCQTSLARIFHSRYRGTLLSIEPSHPCKTALS